MQEIRQLLSKTANNRNFPVIFCHSLPPFATGGFAE
jgi:hypothetical protein